MNLINPNFNYNIQNELQNNKIKINNLESKIKKNLYTFITNSLKVIEQNILKKINLNSDNIDNNNDLIEESINIFMKNITSDIKYIEYKNSQLQIQIENLNSNLNITLIFILYSVFKDIFLFLLYLIISYRKL